MQRIKMLKTACGPKGSFTSGMEYNVDAEVAAIWCKKPDPVAIIVESETATEAPQTVIEPVAKVIDVPKETKPVAKKPAKYRPSRKAAE